MSVRSVKARMHEAVEALPDDVRFSSLTNDIAVMKEFLQAIYSELQTYAFHCGAENDSLQEEAVPSCDVIDSAFVKQLREREFEPAPRRRQYSAVAVGASL